MTFILHKPQSGHDRPYMCTTVMRMPSCCTVIPFVLEIGQEEEGREEATHKPPQMCPVRDIATLPLNTDHTKKNPFK